jgi:hypothetical protein
VAEVKTVLEADWDKMPAPAVRRRKQAKQPKVKS